MKLFVVGFGCGCRDGLTLQAENVIMKSDIITGYTVYTDILKQFFPDKLFVSTAMRQERERVEFALKSAADGKTVSLVCSGDSEVYGMAALAFELHYLYPDVEIEIVSGVTAALSGGAVLGAPLTHDFAVISLSDLLTPWEKIEKRLRCSAMADFTVVLYNPSSKKRADYLKKACDIMLEFKSSETVCGYVKNIGRQGETHMILTLGELRNESVDMFTTIFIGNSETMALEGKMVTPRGYRNV